MPYKLLLCIKRKKKKPSNKKQYKVIFPNTTKWNTKRLLTRFAKFVDLPFVTV